MGIRVVRRACAALIGLACSVWPASSQQTDRKPGADRNFDIRKELDRPSRVGAAAQLAPHDPARDRALIDGRKAAAARREGARIVFNDFGLPKALFHPLGPMTAPSSRDPESIAKDFLSANRELLPSENLRLCSRHSAGGLVFLQFQQTYRGVDVFRGQVNLALNNAGQVVQASAGDMIAEFDLSAVPVLTPEETVERAFQLLELESPPVWKALPPVQDGRTRFADPNGEQFTDITAELSIFPLSPTAAVLAYRLYLEVDGTRWYEMLLDAEEGRLLARYNLYRYAAEGRVWKESPTKGPRELVAFPDGWLPSSGTVTTGNRTLISTPTETTSPTHRQSPTFRLASR